MKYLKHFNESTEDYLSQVLIDVFQEVIDDYGFYREFDSDEDSSGLLYIISRYKKTTYISFYYSIDGLSQHSPVIDSIDFSPYINRLEVMGYDVGVDMNKKLGFVRIEISEMNVKESVENQIDASYILDLMQEIIDEYCLDDYRRITRADGLSNHGWFYYYNFKDTNRDKLMIEIFHNPEEEYEKVIDFDSPCFIGFESRLKSLGYDVKKLYVNNGEDVYVNDANWIKYIIKIL